MHCQRKVMYMAKVMVKVAGGQVQEKDYSSLGQLKAAMGLTNYTASVNGEPESDDYELEDYEVVNLSPSVKGA